MPDTLVGPRVLDKGFDWMAFIKEFERLKAPRGMVPVEWDKFKDDNLKDYNEFRRRLEHHLGPAATPTQLAAIDDAWILLVEALKSGSVEKAFAFISICVAVLKIEDPNGAANRIFWSSPKGKEIARSYLHGKTAEEMRDVSVKLTANAAAPSQFFAPGEVDALSVGSGGKPFVALEGGGLGELLDGLFWNLDWSTSLGIWGVLSRVFATGAVGNAILVVQDGLLVGSVFWNDELPSLRNLQWAGLVEKIFVKYIKADGTVSALIDIDEHPELLPITARRYQSDEAYDKTTKTWKVAGRTAPVYENIRYGTNLGTIKKLATRWKERAQAEPEDTDVVVGHVRTILSGKALEAAPPLPLFQRETGALAQLEVDGMVVQRRAMKPWGQRFGLRISHPDGTGCRYVLVEPPDALDPVGAQEVDVDRVLHMLDRFLQSRVSEWTRLPKCIVVHGNRIIVAGAIVATWSKTSRFPENAALPALPAPNSRLELEAATLLVRRAVHREAATA